MMKASLSFSFLFFFLFFSNCRNEAIEIRSTTVSNNAKARFYLGQIESRDIRFPKNLASDFSELLKYELLFHKYEVNGKIQGFYRKNDEYFSGNLPLSLKKSAGEAHFQSEFKGKLLSREEIRLLSKEEFFDFFIQGTFSVYNNEHPINQKYWCLVFIHIFNNEGQEIGMISSNLENQTNLDSEKLKSVSEKFGLEIIKVVSYK